MDDHTIFDTLYKIILIGDSNVGKTNIISRYCNNSFNYNSRYTIGIDFSTKLIQIEDKIVKIQIWDTAGQEKYRAIMPSYYRNCSGILIIFDITNEQSFDNVSKWYDEVLKNCGTDKDYKTMLIGNKSDLNDKRIISYSTARTFANKNRMLYIETSALNSVNINDAIMKFIHHIYINTLSPSLNNINDINSEENILVNDNIISDEIDSKCAC